MSYHVDVKKLFHDLRGPKGVAALTEELVKVGAEVNRLKAKLKPEAEKKLHTARATVDQLQSRLKKAQVELDRELKKTISVVKKAGIQAEKKLAQMSLNKGLGKKASAKKTSKKAAPKAKTAARTSKKKTSKKSA